MPPASIAIWALVGSCVFYPLLMGERGPFIVLLYSAQTYTVGLCSFNRPHVAFITETSHYWPALLIARLVGIYLQLSALTQLTFCVCVCLEITLIQSDMI